MIDSFKGVTPKIPSSVFVAPSADVIGDVEIGSDSSIWFRSVVRGDVHFIRIGARTNIQDLSMLHVTRKTHPLVIGSDVTVGHGVTLHGCTLKDRILIGMGAIVLDGAVIRDGSIIGAGSIVTEGTVIPPGVLAFGAPARVRRELRPDETGFLKVSARHYVALARDYLEKR
ncbi:MAG: gamma carbonic anhydrase family protein [Nitrospiria bacterium]